MATSSHEQRRQRQQRPDRAQNEQRGDRAAVDLAALEEGRELSPDVAHYLQPQMGNLALQEMMGSESSAHGTRAAGTGQEEEEELAEELIESEDIAEDMELEGVRFGGGGGGGGGGGSGDPWDVGKLFGGEDEPDDSPNRPRQRQRHGPRGEPEEDEDPLDEPLDEEGDDDPGALDPELMAPVEARLGDARPAPARGLVRDARYAAVEPALNNALFLGRRRLDPEDLVGTDSLVDPVGRPAGIGRFLAEAADSARARSLGRLVGHGMAALAPEVGGYAGGVARLCALAVCAQAAEGGGERTDRAVNLALVDDAWPAAVQAARPLSRQGRLRAPLVLVAATQRPLHPPGPERIPEPGALGGRALRRLLPPPLSPEIPLPDLHALRPAASTGDADLADLDAILMQLTGGADPREADPDPPLTGRDLRPTLRGARALMNALGRSYVELAAAALAVHQVRPEAPIRGVLVMGDRAVSDLARSVLRAARGLERSTGKRLSQVDPARIEGAVRDLVQARDALLALKEWYFDAMAGALDA